MNVLRFSTLSTAIVGLAMLFSGCGGSDDASPVSDASYSQTAPAGALTIAAGQASGVVSIVRIDHHVGNKITKIKISAAIKNARSTGATAAGTRWVLRNGADVIAQGPLSAAPAGGANGSTTHEVAMSKGSRVSVEITGSISSPGAAAMQWDEASLSLEAQQL